MMVSSNVTRHLLDNSNVNPFQNFSRHLKQKIIMQQKCKNENEEIELVNKFKENYLLSDQYKNMLILGCIHRKLIKQIQQFNLISQQKTKKNNKRNKTISQSITNYSVKSKNQITLNNS
ncbi:hypothetical protein ABPG72_009284 [Tetrahymena utriculariae]